MALEQSKIVAYGPFTFEAYKMNSGNTALELLDVSGGSGDDIKYEGLKSDSVSFSIEAKEGNIEFEDGTEKYWMEGRTVTVEVTIAELVAAELDKAEEAVAIKLVFSQSGKTVQVPPTAKAVAGAYGTLISSVEDGKTKFMFRYFGAADSTFATDIMTIS